MKNCLETHSEPKESCVIPGASACCVGVVIYVSCVNTLLENAMQDLGFFFFTSSGLRWV